VGDGVYARFDEANYLVLRVPAEASFSGKEQRIFLDASAWYNLVQYGRRVFR